MCYSGNSHIHIRLNMALKVKNTLIYFQNQSITSFFRHLTWHPIPLTNVYFRGCQKTKTLVPGADFGVASQKGTGDDEVLDIVFRYTSDIPISWRYYQILIAKVIAKQLHTGQQHWTKLDTINPSSQISSRWTPSLQAPQMALRELEYPSSSLPWSSKDSTKFDSKTDSKTGRK